jgi:hypothetical protein
MGDGGKQGRRVEIVAVEVEPAVLLPPPPARLELDSRTAPSSLRTVERVPPVCHVVHVGPQLLDRHIDPARVE